MRGAMSFLTAADVIQPTRACPSSSCWRGRCWVADGFGLTRANTTAVIVLRVEVDSAAGVARIQQNFHRVLLDVTPDLVRPI